MSAAIAPIPQSDRRGDPRALIAMTALVMADQKPVTEHLTCDLSAGGVRLCGVPLARPGSEIEVTLQMRDRCVRTAGRLLRIGSRHGKPDFAIQFVDLDASDEDAIQDVVLEALSRRERRSILLLKNQPEVRWAGWSWLDPLTPICSTAMTPLLAIQQLYEHAIEIGILNRSGDSRLAQQWMELAPEISWRAIDRAGRLHAIGSDRRRVSLL